MAIKTDPNPCSTQQGPPPYSQHVRPEILPAPGHRDVRPLEQQYGMHSYFSMQSSMCKYFFDEDWWQIPNPGTNTVAACQSLKTLKRAVEQRLFFSGMQPRHCMPTLLAGKLKSSGTAFMFGVAGASDENSLNPMSPSGLKRIGEGQQMRILRDETLGFRAYRAFLSLRVES